MSSGIFNGFCQTMYILGLNDCDTRHQMTTTLSPSSPENSSQISELKENYVQLTSQISILLAILPLIYITLNVYDQGWARITLPVLLQPFLFLLPLLLNYLGLTTMSRIMLSWSMPVLAMTFSIYNKSHGMDHQTSHYMGIQFSILASAIIPFLVFRLGDSFLLVLSLLPSFLALLGFDFIHSIFGVGYKQVGLSETGYSLTTMRVMIAFILVSGGSFILKRSIERKEALNQKLIIQLTKKNNENEALLEEITAQNEELQQSQEQVNQINHHLEELVLEKTKNIQKQNEVLIKYAYTNAHYVRGPVARLLGLIQISRLKTDLDYSWFFSKVEIEAREADRIISSIAKDLNEIDQTD